ncbi:hypothetical protein KKC94_02055 [Patescibacteria group bacterium]|nr:hypothetical protein [Patescibacteria group bacterium]
MSALNALKYIGPADDSDLQPPSHTSVRLSLVTSLPDLEGEDDTTETIDPQQMGKLMAEAQARQISEETRRLIAIYTDPNYGDHVA